VTPPRKVVVVGASLAGMNAVQAARESGFDGDLTLIGDELDLPYDRPPLSKGFLARDASADAPHLAGATELERELRVELRLGRPASALDPVRKVVHVGGDQIDYDAVLIATGATARVLPGATPRSGVHTIRTLADALALRQSLDVGAELVVIGGGFIGSEVAAIAKERGLKTTIVEALATPLGRILGDSAGHALTALHQRHGVAVECNAHVESLEGSDHVTAVRLRDGRRIPADVVVVAIGVAPATDWLKGSGLALDSGVVCDARLSASADNVWAAGDVARWPNRFSGAPVRIEHWTNAVDQGRHAMLNALDPEAATEYDAVPYFWSDWYDSVIQFAGVATGEPVLAGGAWDSDAFVALYFDGDRFRGALTLNRRAEIMKYRALLDRGASAADALAFAASRAKAAVLRTVLQPSIEA
jgi:NADPH-dependent 2,4-dienoyl-CoA reductase/sulfur reductase-like enzyme